jgi:hypothetical protein
LDDEVGLDTDCLQAPEVVDWLNDVPGAATQCALGLVATDLRGMAERAIEGLWHTRARVEEVLISRFIASRLPCAASRWRT